MKRLLALLIICGQSWGTIALVGTCQTGSAVGGGTATTGSINTTGATLLTLTISGGNACTSSTVSDSNSNTWNAGHSPLADSGGAPGGGADTCIWYSYSKSGSALVVGSGHTASFSNSFPGGVFCAWSGTLTGATDPYDATAGSSTAVSSTGTSTSVQPGSITPSQAGNLIVTGVGTNGGTGMSINSSFTVQGGLDFSNGVNYGDHQGTLIQGAAAAVNPTWTLSSGTAGLAASIVSFKAAATGAVSAGYKRKKLDRLITD